MLVYHVCRVGLAWDVVEADDSSCDRIAAAVERQGIVPFVEFALWHRGSVDH